METAITIVLVAGAGALLAVKWYRSLRQVFGDDEPDQKDSPCAGCTADCALSPTEKDAAASAQCAERGER